jgi:hypothetical protein
MLDSDKVGVGDKLSSDLTSVSVAVSCADSGSLNACAGTGVYQDGSSPRSCARSREVVCSSPQLRDFAPRAPLLNTIPQGLLPLLVSFFFLVYLPFRL